MPSNQHLNPPPVCVVAGNSRFGGDTPRNGMGLQLVAASVGAAILTGATKNIVERVRPSAIPRLIEVSGFSYPSGHATLTTAL